MEVENGKFVDTFSTKEDMYLHFINWKRKMEYSEIVYNEDPRFFYVSFEGLHYSKYSFMQTSFRAIINYFNGYYSILFKRRFRKKIIHLKNKI